MVLLMPIQKAIGTDYTVSAKVFSRKNKSFCTLYNPCLWHIYLIQHTNAMLAFTCLQKAESAFHVLPLRAFQHLSGAQDCLVTNTVQLAQLIHGSVVFASNTVKRVALLY